MYGAVSAALAYALSGSTASLRGNRDRSVDPASDLSGMGGRGRQCGTSSRGRVQGVANANEQSRIRAVRLDAGPGELLHCGADSKNCSLQPACTNPCTPSVGSQMGWKAQFRIAGSIGDQSHVHLPTLAVGRRCRTCDRIMAGFPGWARRV